ncbi:hypothetical protein [Paludisphaera rhizosphaerae]|uniref:hypothetical protein n=1 Tax=Paludisphaera rhizosphaerae TaxID=2711216 RepID=UPI0013EB0C52|nr:hypothetical protein [Paludisphaera rhizosphaerae]
MSANNGPVLLQTPSIQVVALAKDVIVGNRVCSAGEVVTVNEVTARGAINRTAPVAALAEGASFQTPVADLDHALEMAGSAEIYAVLPPTS